MPSGAAGEGGGEEAGEGCRGGRGGRSGGESLSVLLLATSAAATAPLIAAQQTNTVQHRPNGEQPACRRRCGRSTRGGESIRLLPGGPLNVFLPRCGWMTPSGRRVQPVRPGSGGGRGAGSLVGVGSWLSTAERSSSWRLLRAAWMVFTASAWIGFISAEPEPTGHLTGPGELGSSSSRLDLRGCSLTMDLSSKPSLRWERCRPNTYGLRISACDSFKAWAYSRRAIRPR